MAGITLQERRPMANLRSDPTSPWRHVDVVLLAAVALVAVIGVLMIYSVTRGAEAPYDSSFAKKQLMYLMLGGLAMAGVMAMDYRRLRDFAMTIYGATVIGLVLVLVPALGQRQNGTQGWFQLGAFQLQPSEFAKIGLIVGFAFLANQYSGEIIGRRLVVLLLLGAAPMGLVMLQPDLGTTLISAFVTILLLVAAGASGRQLALLGLFSLVLVGAVLQSGLLDAYQKDRLTSFVAQDQTTVKLSEASSAEYNLTQAKIAIGSGGLTGKGLFQGPQTRLRSVPYQHTDFIFTAVGEQFGLLGAGTLLGLFSVIVWRVWRSAQLARDDFGSLICVGVLAMLVFQIFENVGMTMGIMPITGIPLPFMSYGGSSAITYFVAVGLVLNVHMHRFN
jgi:rod shape determining protein RodA